MSSFSAVLLLLVSSLAAAVPRQTRSGLRSARLALDRLSGVSGSAAPTARVSPRPSDFDAYGQVSAAEGPATRETLGHAKGAEAWRAGPRAPNPALASQARTAASELHVWNEAVAAGFARLPLEVQARSKGPHRAVETYRGARRHAQALVSARVLDRSHGPSAQQAFTAQSTVFEELSNAVDRQMAASRVLKAMEYYARPGAFPSLFADQADVATAAARAYQLGTPLGAGLPADP